MSEVGDRPYVPGSTGKLTLQWISNELHRIASAITNKQQLGITYLVAGDSPYTTRDGDKVILADTASGAITVNLQAGQDQRVLYVKNIATSGANAVTVTPDGSDDYDRTGGSITLAAATLDAVQIIYSKQEANWFSL